MPQLIGIVIVIVLAIFALSAIAGLIYSALLWGPILAACWIVLDQVQSRRLAALADPIVRGRVAAASIVKGKLAFSVKRNELEQYMNLDLSRVGVMLLGFCVALIVIAMFGREAAFSLAQMMPREDGLRSVAEGAAMVGPFLFILVGVLRMHRQADWNTRARQRLEEQLQQGTAPLDTVHEIEQTQKQIDALMQRLTGTTSAGVLAQANRILQDNIALLFTYPEELKQRLQEPLVPAQRLLRRLQTFAAAVDEAQQLHSRVVRMAMGLGHRSLMSLAEDALTVIEAAPRFIVSDRFDKAEEHLAGVRQELQTALDDPELFGDEEDEESDDAAPLLDCYARLRIDRSVTAQQLEDLWKRLRQTYHPDKGIADHHAYQAVRDDIDAVARDRGFTLRGFSEA